MADVLAIGPHPDDMELSAGGTLALLSISGKDVVMVDLTAGELGSRGSAELRKVEAKRAAETLGASSRECLDLPDGGVLRSDHNHLLAVVTCIRRHRPSLIITMSSEDEHPDHIESSHLVRRAAYLAGLRNWPEPDQSPHRTPCILLAMGRTPFTPAVVIDISSAKDKKQEAIAAYQSQFFREVNDPVVTPISEPTFLPRLRARDRYYGGQIGVEAGEPFLHYQGPWPIRSVAGLWDGLA